MTKGLKAKIWTATVIVLFLGGLAVVVVPGKLKEMAFQRPVSYNPPTLSKAEQDEAEARGWQKSQEFYNSVQRKESFTMTFKQGMVNDLLVHDDVIKFVDATVNQAIGKKVGLGVFQVDFDDGIISVIVPAKISDREIFLTVRLKPTMVRDGLFLKVELLRPKAGTLVLPDFVVRRQLNELTYKLEDSYLKAHSKSDGKLNAQSEKEVEDIVQDMVIPALMELIREKQVEVLPKFRGDSDRWARLVGIEVGDGKLVLEIQPLSE